MFNEDKNMWTTTLDILMYGSQQAGLSEHYFVFGGLFSSQTDAHKQLSNLAYNRKTGNEKITSIKIKGDLGLDHQERHK